MELKAPLFVRTPGYVNSWFVFRSGGFFLRRGGIGTPRSFSPAVGPWNRW